MVQSGDCLESEDRLVSLYGSKGHDANIIKLFSIAHLPKEPFPDRRNLFHGRRSATWVSPQVQRWKGDGSRTSLDDWPNPSLHGVDPTKHTNGRLTPKSGGDSHYTLQGQASSKDTSSIQPSGGGYGGDDGRFARDVEYLTLPQHPRPSPQASQKAPTCRLWKQSNASPIIRAELGSRISKKSQCQSTLHEKEAVKEQARQTHTAMERQRRLRISSAIRQIADFLGVHGSKVEILESAAKWIGDAKSKIAEPVTVPDRRYEDHVLGSENPQTDCISFTSLADDCYSGRDILK